MAARRNDAIVGPRDAVAIGVLVALVAARGDALLAGLLLGVVAGRLRSGMGAGLAMAAVSIRWGSTSLDTIAGAQSVLGPAGITGGGADVAAVWLAGAALILAGAVAPRVDTGRLGRWVRPAAFGVAAALAVAGPGAGGGLWVRAGASVAAPVACWLLATRRHWSRVMALGALVAGVAAVALAVLGR